MSPIVILAGARTPIGRLSGSLADLSATDLGAAAITAALERSGLTGADVDFAYMGNVISAGVGQVPARRAASDGGIPLTTPSTLLNRACLSGMHAVHLAGQMVRLGEAEVIVAGGMESMTNAPHLLTGSRRGFRIGDATLVDSMMADGLTCTIEHCAMGEATERHAGEMGMPLTATTPADRAQPVRSGRPGKVAGHEVVGAHLPHHRFIGCTDLGCPWAPGPEPATGRRIDRRRNLVSDGGLGCVNHRRGFRSRGEEYPCVGV